jgi:Flp pilus assembly pilin Flp
VRHPTSIRGERGQATAEYALVLLGAAAVALLLVAWATDTDAIGRLLDGVLDKILGEL